MATKSENKKSLLWIWCVVACVASFMLGLGTGKLMRSSLARPTPSQNTSVVPFNVPQIQLPANWSTKEKLPGNSFDTAFPLNPGIKTQGTLNTDNALDYYTFTLNAPSQIIVTVTDVPKSLYWVLYDKDFHEIASTYRTGTVEGSTQVTLEFPGKYYLKVWADYHILTNYPYTIRLSILPFFE